MPCQSLGSTVAELIVVPDEQEKVGNIVRAVAVFVLSAHVGSKRNETEGIMQNPAV